MCITCGENLERRYFGRRQWGIGEDAEKWWTFPFPRQLNCLEEIRFSENPLLYGIRGEEHEDDLRGEPDGSQPFWHKDEWRVKPETMFGRSKATTFIVITSEYHLLNQLRVRNPCSETRCKGSVIANERWYFHFPVADGTVKLSGGDQDLRIYPP